MKTIIHKGLRWLSSDVDGGYRTGVLVETRIARKICRLWEKRVKLGHNIHQFQGMLHVQGIFFSGEVIDCIFVVQDDKQMSMLYVHCNCVK